MYLRRSEILRSFPDTVTATRILSSERHPDCNLKKN